MRLAGHYFTWRLWQASKQGRQLRAVCLLTACQGQAYRVAERVYHGVQFAAEITSATVVASIKDAL